jgi:hypothetical protein
MTQGLRLSDARVERPPRGERVLGLLTMANIGELLALDAANRQIGQSPELFAAGGRGARGTA